LYFLDSEEALNIRTELNKECDKNVIIYLENYFRENNKFAQCYKLMKDVYENQIKICENNGEKIPEIRLLFSLKDDFNEKRYNIPAKEKSHSIDKLNIHLENKQNIIYKKMLLTKKLKSI
jgi:hypothetical protein